jgi:predicted DNA-binding protein
MIRIAPEDRRRLDMVASAVGTTDSQLARTAIYKLLGEAEKRGIGLDLVTQVAAARRREGRA